MLKKAKLLLIGAAALVSLVGCGTKTETCTDEDEFCQNDNPTIQGIEMYVVGSHWNSWDPSTIKDAEGCSFKKQSDGTYTWSATITQEMVDAWCGFKFIADNSWSSQYGMEDVNYEKSNDAFKEMVGEKENFKEDTKNRSNVVVTKAGTIEIEYDPTNFTSEQTSATTYTNKFAVTFTAA